MLDWQRARARVVVAGFATLAASACVVPAALAEGESAAPSPLPAEIMPMADKSILLDVAAAGPHLVAVGSRGHILLSDDGDHWRQVESPVRSTLTSVFFLDAENGWAVGHDATILRTSDGGQNWSLQNYQPELEKPLLDVLFLDAQHGLAVGAYGLFEQTSDGGSHWAPLAAPSILKDGLHLYSIRKLGDGRLLVAGEQGLVGVSVDGGATWTRLDTGYKGTFFGAAPVGTSSVLLCGLRGNVYFSANVGTSPWQKIDTGNSSSMYSCQAEAGGKVIMAGSNGLIERVDTVSLKVEKLPSPVDTPVSAVLPWNDRLIVAGEAGVHAAAAH